jgi:predicted nucleic acid-binding protein
VLSHPFVLGELALGGLRQRAHINTLMAALPQAQVATDAEVMHLISHATLSGKGIGYIDAHLLAATLLTPSARLFTLDMRLRSVTQALGVAEVPRVH